MIQNPLLKPFLARDESVPFDEIQVEHYLPALEAAIAQAQDKLSALRSNPAPAGFENTIVALEESSELVDRIASIYGNLEVAHADDAHQAIAKEFYPKLSSFSSDVSLDSQIFARVKAVHDRRQELPLNPEQAKLLEKTYLSFTRNGALLDEKGKTRLREIDLELSILSPKFSENVLKATNAFELWITDSKELAGLPDSALEAAAHAAEQKGGKGQWLFTLQAPSYMPLVTYADNRELREKAWRAYGSKSFGDAHDNQETILRTVTLKHERAKLLGFETHAAYVLAERMAKNAKTVHEFMTGILKVSKNAAARDLDEVRTFARETAGITEVKPWDLSYFSEKLKEQKYAFNEEQLRPYFKLENVVAGVFEHAKRLYGLQFKEANEVKPYHPDVKTYEVLDAEGCYLSFFYTDFFPRKTKKPGAWMTSFREQGIWSGTVKRPHVSIVCNFTQPTPTKPSLLTYDEVRTLFHEFGHALHGMLSQCSYRSLGGTQVYWDFVELPSQIMENWVGEKESLDLFARHYETGEPIPAELVEKIKRAQKFQSGWMSLRQLQFGYLDMAWHSTDPTQIQDVDAFEVRATAETRLIEKIPGTNASCSFSHIFAGGYSAGYYSYKWAEVLDADAFEFFKEKGLFDPEVARSFRVNILEKGGTEHPMELYKKFRGREPDATALLRRDGLI